MAGNNYLSVSELRTFIIGKGLASESEVDQAIDSTGNASDCEDVLDQLMRSKVLTESQRSELSRGNVGRSLGGCRLIRELGKGGMGEVYLAEQTSLDRKVAIKTLPEHLTENDEYVARFKREAALAAKLNHPNIVQIHEVGEEDGTQYIILEYVEGTTLADVIASKGALAPADALTVVTGVAVGLSHAHKAGVIHRDIKPANIMIHEGNVKILDLGLARDHGRRTQLTQDERAMGTPDYMSPEQFTDARNADARSDIYSLGCLWFCLLTGKPPYADFDVFGKAMAHIQEPYPDLNADVPSEHRKLIKRMVAKQPPNRVQTANELLAILQAIGKATSKNQLILDPIRDDDTILLPTHKANFRWQLVAVCLVTFASLSYWLIGQSEPDSTEPDVSNSKTSSSTTAVSAKNKEVSKTHPSLTDKLFPGPIGLVQEIPWERHPIHAVCFSRDGRFLFYGLGFDSLPDEARPFVAYEFETCKPRYFEIGNDPVGSIATSPNGKLIVLGRDDGINQVYEISKLLGGELEPLKEFEHPPGRVSLNQFDMSGSRLLSASMSWKQGGRVNLMETSEWGLMAAHRRLTFRCVMTAAISPDGQFYASVGADPTEIVVTGTNERHACTVNVDPDVQGLQLIAVNGKIILYATTTESKLFAWEIPSGKVVIPGKRTETHRRLTPLHHGEFFAASGLDDTIRILHGATGRTLLAYSCGKYQYQGLAVSPDNRLLASSTGTYWNNFTWVKQLSYRVALFKLPTLARLRELAKTEIEFDPKHNIVVTGAAKLVDSMEGWGATWGAQKGELIRNAKPLGVESKFQKRDVVNGHDGKLVCDGGSDPAVSLDGKYFAYVVDRSGAGRNLVICDGEFQEIAAIKLAGFPQWSRDSDELYYYDDTNKTLMKTSTASRFQTREEVFKCPQSNFPAISPDGRYVAYSSKGRFLIRDLSKPSQPELLNRSFPRIVRALPAWSNDSKFVAISEFGVGAPTGVWVVNRSTGVARKLLRGKMVLPKWSPDDSQISVDERDLGQVRVYKLNRKFLP